MPGRDALLLRLRKIDSWNRWRLRNPAITPDLAGADLRGLSLTRTRLVETLGPTAVFIDEPGADLTHVNLTGAMLSGSELHYVNFSRATLAGADFTDAYLYGCDFQYADLTNACFTGAALYHARFYWNRLAGTVFRGARLSNTAFSCLSLDGAVGLEEVIHDGKSSVGLDVILRSSIPRSFLMGCGVPAEVCDNLSALGA